MSIEEHLVENAICELERNKDYKKFMASELLIEQSKQTKNTNEFYVDYGTICSIYI